MSVKVTEVSFSFIQQHMDSIVKVSTRAFMQNHKITKEAYQKTDGRYRHRFEYLLGESVADMMEQIERNKGLFFVAEKDHKIVAISVGCPYGTSAFSDKMIKKILKSKCCYKEVMGFWWNLMQKYTGNPPGKLFHQAMMVVDPEYSGKGIGAQICALTANKIAEANYDGYAVETSSESADCLAMKLKSGFQVVDIDSVQGLTLRVQCKSESILRWFLDKKNPQVLAQEMQEMHVAEISRVGVHYLVEDMSVWDSDPQSKKPALVMLHPNSASRLFFKNQMEDASLTDKYRLIALDLPGHGDSKQAHDPEAAYTFPGYAKAVIETIKQLGLTQFAIFGQSLGGNVAIEAMDQIKGLCGIILTGAPPVQVSVEGFASAFGAIDPEMVKLMGKSNFSRAEAKCFMSALGTESWMAEYGLKTDGRARQRLVQSIQEGIGRDQRQLIASSRLPVAIIGGDKDPAMPKEYLQRLVFGNLWGMRFIENADHSVVYTKAASFNPVLKQFLDEAAFS